MQKLFITIAIAAICGTSGFALADAKHNKAHKSSGVKGERVYCCHGKNDCDKLHTKSECEKDGGKVVSSCRECK